MNLLTKFKKFDSVKSEVIFQVLFLTEDLSVDLAATNLVVSEGDVTFYGGSGLIIAYFNKPLGIIKLNNN